MTTPENPARWERDPSGRHEYRYWDGTRWTEHVADRGVQGIDPPDAAAGGTAGAGGGYAPQPAPGYPSGPVAGPPPGAYDPTAVMGRRYGAFFIDLAISLLVSGIVFAATAEQRTVAEMLRIEGCRVDAGSDQVECDDRAIVQVDDTVYEATAATALGIVGFSFLYFALLQGLTGSTLGKLMTGIRVVREDGSVQGIGRGVIRWLLLFVDGPLTLYLCGIITTATSRGHRRLGDMAASTYVVGAAHVGRPVVV